MARKDMQWLKAHIARGIGNKEGGLPGMLHRTWIDITQISSSKEDIAILSARETGKKAAIENRISYWMMIPCMQITFSCCKASALGFWRPSRRWKLRVFASGALTRNDHNGRRSLLRWHRPHLLVPFRQLVSSCDAHPG